MSQTIARTANNEPFASLAKSLGRGLFWLLVWAGKPWGGLRPRRIYYILGRRVFSQPQFKWFRHAQGYRMLLSPHYYMDRAIICHGQYDEILHRVIRALVKPSMHCMDIGANMGEFSLHLAKMVGERGKVYAFEPVPTIAERLAQHAKANGFENVISLNQCVLADSVGQVQLNIADGEAENQGLASFVNLDNPTAQHSISVPANTLDNFVAQHKLKRLDFIKIDAQGAEPLILDGGLQTLRELKPDLLLEVSADDLRPLGLTGATLIEKVMALGYTVYEISDDLKLTILEPSKLSPAYFAPNVYCTCVPRERLA